MKKMQHAHFKSSLVKSQRSQTNYSLTNAEAVVSIGADFMMNGRDSLRLSKEFADARRVYVAKNDEEALSKLQSTDFTLLKPTSLSQVQTPITVIAYRRALASNSS